MRLADAGLAISSMRVAFAVIKTAHLLAGLSLELRRPASPRWWMASPGLKASVPAAGPPRGAGRAAAAARRPRHPRDADRRTRSRHAAAGLRRRTAPLRTRRPDNRRRRDRPPRGLLLTIRRSKTDQQGASQRLPSMPSRPSRAGATAAAHEAWLRHRREASDLD